MKISKKTIELRAEEIRQVWADSASGNILVIYDYGQGVQIDSVHPSLVGCAQIQIPVSFDMLEDYDIIDDILNRI